MKIKIKNFNGELPSYLTVGKVYDAKIQYNTVVIKNDVGGTLITSILDSAFLNGGSWEVVESE